MDFLTRIYEQHQHDERKWPIFDAMLSTLSICLKAVLVLFIFAFLGAIYVPLIRSIIIYVAYDERHIILPQLIPGTSLDIDNQYELNIICQIVVGHLCGAAYMYFDLLFVLLFVHVILMANIVCDEIRTTEHLLRTDILSNVELRTNMRSVIELQNDLRK